MNNLTASLSLDREDMSEFARQLFLKDIKRVIEEYFECDEAANLEITRSEEGFLVCVLFSARRIKTVKNPL
ncbi:MAG: hypothetical protein J1G07_06260 [Clostridiales bacterium]|nr:hypothetical protein [Clostridiales bacterium]